MGACRTCVLTARRDEGGSPPWDLIVRTPGWDLVHAYDTSIPGWLCLIVRRHITAVADLTDAEAAELGPLVKAVSAALADVVGCTKTYVVQFAEHADHPHVHVHVIPRMPDQPDELRGQRIFAALGVPDADAVPEPVRNEIATAVAAHLVATSGGG